VSFNAERWKDSCSGKDRKLRIYYSRSKTRLTEKVCLLTSSLKLYCNTNPNPKAQ